MPRTEIGLDRGSPIALHRNQRRLLRIGGVVLTLVIVLAGLAVVRQTLDNYHRAQQETFLDGVSMVDASLARLDLEHRDDLRIAKALWQSQSNYLQSIGAPLKDRYDRQGKQILVQANPTVVPWLILGGPTTPLSDDVITTGLGLVEQAAIIAIPWDTWQSPRIRRTVVVYDEASSLFLISNTRSETALLSALKVKNRAEAFGKLEVSPSAWISTTSSPEDAERTNSPEIPFFIAKNPLSGLLSVTRGLTFWIDHDLYVRCVIYEPLDLLAENVPRNESFALVADGQSIPLGDTAHRLTKSDVATLLRASSVSSGRRTDRPAHVSLDGADAYVGSLRHADWMLVHRYSRSDMLEEVGPPIARIAATTVLIAGGLWALMIFIDRRVFTPAIARVSQVYESDALSRIIIDTSPVGLCLLDQEDGTPILKNDVMETLGKREDGSASIYQRLIDKARLTAEVGGNTIPFEYPLDVTGDDGKVQRLLVSAVPCDYRQKRVLLCVVRNATAQWELEENLRRSRIDADRAKDAAEAANRAKSSFVSAMSHEIRTPLNGVLGHLELLARSALEPKQRERLQRIRFSAESLQSIVTDVLDFSKIEAGQMSIDPMPFAPRPVLEQVALLFAPMAQQKGLDLFIATASDLKRCYVSDASRIRQILNNLVGNAIKFTEKGKVLLAVNRISDPPDGREWLHFQVVDSGVGIAASELSRLFEPFTQANASISRRFGGTGLGLTLCRQLAELLGGSIEVTSTPGTGSVFSLRIPTAECAEVPEMPPLDLAGLRIALLSASTEWCEDIANLLRQRGAEVVSSTSPSALQSSGVIDGSALVIFGDKCNWTIEEERRLIAVSRRIIRAHTDGPWVPEFIDDAWHISCYSSDALFAALTGEPSAVVDHLPHHADAVPSSADMPTSTFREKPSRGRVLAADDNPVNRELIQQQLETLGYSVDTVEDGDVALRLWKANHYDVVLTDISMPRMDGNELARALRAQGATIPIVAITAAASTSEKALCKDEGITELLLKPLSLAQLDEVLVRVTSGSTVPASVEEPPKKRALSDKVRRAFVLAGEHDVTQMREALSRGDVASFLERLHSMKGALLMLGERALADNCAAVEDRVSARGLGRGDSEEVALVGQLDEVVTRYRND